MSATRQQIKQDGLQPTTVSMPCPCVVTADEVAKALEVSDAVLTLLDEEL